MDKEEIVLQGKHLESLINEAEKFFNTNREGINIEVLEENKALFGTNYKIKASLKSITEYRNIDKLEEELNSIDTSWESKDVNNEIINEEKEEKEDSSEEDIITEDNDCSYEITVTPDKMEAYMTVNPPKGKGRAINTEDIMEQLQLYNINNGVIDSTIDFIANNKTYSEKVLIAKGTSPIDGTDAVLNFNFDISNERKVSILDDGKVNYRELSLIKNVLENEILVTATLPTEGISGYNVYGEEVKAKDGKKANLPKGKNVSVSEDELSLISTIKGEVKLADNKVSVSPVYEVPLNVDNSTGNIKFYGKVIVKGNVITGFSIDADDDIEVYGVVEGAHISSKGNIILHRGMQGMNKGELHCEGDLIAKFIENSKIFVKGNIEAEAIMHSIVYCGKKLELKGKKGLLVGGDTKTCEEIKAKVIGSPMATATILEVGTNPEIRTRHDTLKTERVSTFENLQKVAQAVDILTKFSRKAELPEDKAVLLNKSVIMKVQLKNKLEKIDNEIKDLETYIDEISNGKVKVQETTYPGTKITIGSNSIYIKDQVQYAIFYKFGGEIKIGTYEQ